MSLLPAPYLAKFCLFVHFSSHFMNENSYYGAFNVEVHGGEPGYDIAVAALQKVDARDQGGAASDGGGDDIGQPGAQVGNGDRLLLVGCERRRPDDNRAVLMAGCTIEAA